MHALTKTRTMCDKELLVGYLYGELAAGERAAFEAHLASCADCREEVDGLRARARTSQSWAPPEPEFGFQHRPRSRGRVGADAAGGGCRRRGALPRRPMLSARWPRRSRTSRCATTNGGVTVRTGGTGTVPRGRCRPARRRPTADSQRVDGAACSESRKRQLAALASAATARRVARRSQRVPARMSDAELLRVVRALIEESEARQQGELARRILQVNRDVEAARRDRLRSAGAAACEEFAARSDEALRTSTNVRSTMRARRAAAAA